MNEHDAYCSNLCRHVENFTLLLGWCYGLSVFWTGKGSRGLECNIVSEPRWNYR